MSVRSTVQRELLRGLHKGTLDPLTLALQFNCTGLYCKFVGIVSVIVIVNVNAIVAAFVTAIANDTNYNEIFINQLKIHFSNKDKILIFSASGNSENLVKAAKWVKKKKGKVISILGFDGGKLKSLSDTCIHIPTEKGEYGPVEDFQLMMNHILAHWFQKNLKK